ncbi:hypothetical protein FISHEDRAFT_68152 [Fistulina hepatica ATCC 64428]|uniref:DUF6589 domain-containing protein n=1 Tax=Fistulina hepatica ATCC 64428 TaxID=1128425 RepID=A0A0D7A2U6_9AGAR|nr:hypothetical protein FISHEDRAFT_68152 [Fistulina hepatica ATCC 64428]
MPMELSSSLPPSSLPSTPSPRSRDASPSLEAPIQQERSVHVGPPSFDLGMDPSQLVAFSSPANSDCSDEELHMTSEDIPLLDFFHSTLDESTDSPPSTPTPATRPLQPRTPSRQHGQLLFADSSDPGVQMSTPIIGTRMQRSTIRREKSKRKRKEMKEHADEVQREVQVSRCRQILVQMAHDGVSLSDFMHFVFDPSNMQGNIRYRQFFQEHGNATRILHWWAKDKTGRDEVQEWAVRYVEELISAEARQVTKGGDLKSTKHTVDRSFVTRFSLSTIGDMLSTKLRVATWMIVITMILSCLGSYNLGNNWFKRINGLYLYATGAMRQTIGVLSHMGISESFPGLLTKPREAQLSAPMPDNLESVQPGSGTLRQLSASMRNATRDVAATGLYGLVYDNINMMFKNAEQVVGRHDSQENGTAGTIFPLWRANINDISTQSLHNAFLTAPPLQLSDILHSPDEAAFFKTCLQFTILQIIVQYGGEGFAKYQGVLAAGQPQSEHVVEVHKTDLFTLPPLNIDEASIDGNAQLDEAYVKELHLRESRERFWDLARFIGGDQLSQARRRALMTIRAGHEGGYPSFTSDVEIAGLFHTKMADSHGFLITHWGSSSKQSPGSLAFHNTLLDRLPITLTSLPAFRTCRDLVFVSLYARVLHCLLLVSNEPSLDAYLAQGYSFDEICDHALQILTKYTDSRKVGALRWERNLERLAFEQDNQPGSVQAFKPATGDMVFENALLFLRDALISREFSDAIKCGDSGPLSFRGNGRTKYAYEMLYVIHNMTHVWPKPIRDIVLNNWILNPSGKRFGGVEIDLVQEHMNFWTKMYYKAHGSNQSWDWLAMVGPCIPVLQELATSVHTILGTNLGSHHAPPDLSRDIATLMNSLAIHSIYQEQQGRALYMDDKPTVDVISVGLQHLGDSSNNPLHMYNCAFTRLQERRRMQPVTVINPTNSRIEHEADDVAVAVNKTVESIAGPSDEGLDLDLDIESDARDMEIIFGGLETAEETLQVETERDVAFDMDVDDSQGADMLDIAGWADLELEEGNFVGDI